MIKIETIMKKKDELKIKL